MAVTTQDIKISCHNSIIKGPGAKSNDGHPWRNWKITLVAMDGEEEIKGKLSIILDHVEYILHPTFQDPIRVKEEEPYMLQEKGWGEFDMRIVLYFRENITDPQVLLFDLNFAMSNYTVTHTIEFPNASPELIRLITIDASTVKAILTAQAEAEAQAQAQVTSAATAEPTKSEKLIVSPSPRKGSKRPRISSPSWSSSSSNSNKNKYGNEVWSRQPMKEKHNSTHQGKKASKKVRTEKSSKRSLSRRSSSSTPQIQSPSFSPRVSSPLSPAYYGQTPSSHKSPLSPHLDLDYSNASQSDAPHATTPLSPHLYSDEENRSTTNYQSPSYQLESDDNMEYVSNLEDVYRLRPIHFADIDEKLREEWDIPDIKMAEFARRMYLLKPEQFEEFQKIIIDNPSDTMNIIPEEDGTVGIDLYSLGKPLLEKLWEYLVDTISDDNESFVSEDFHPSDLEFGSDIDLNEYESDELREDTPLRNTNNKYESHEDNEEGYYYSDEDHK
ncbi:MAG: yeats family-domain-containing protein [Benjaminiella poitrasii]|nr:MAG: yeats family-domain-containing protein [Benjaminiella poitrasii]